MNIWFFIFLFESFIGAGLSGLGTSSKVGIIIGIVLVLLLVLLILILLKRKGYITCCSISQMMPNKPRRRPQNEAKQNGGGAVMKNVNTYETKQHHANKSNIKVPGKKEPQKYKPQVNIKPWIIPHISEKNLKQLQKMLLSCLKETVFWKHHRQNVYLKKRDFMNINQAKNKK